MKHISILLLSLIFGLSLAQETITLNFAARVGDQMAACGQTYDGLGTMNSSVEFQDLRFYVSNVRLMNAAGEEIPLELAQDGMWQYEDVALLDFEDGSALCAQSGNAATNSVVTGTVPAGDYTGLVFTLGVPFSLNHNDVTTAPAPLNISSMWWSWQGGYKHIRIDLMSHSAMTMDTMDKSETSEDGEAESSNHGNTAMSGFWPIHLGSTGCASEASAIAPTTECSTPNTFEVRLDSFDLNNDTVVADVASLLTNVDVSQSLELMPPGCMSGPQDPDCKVLFENLGLTAGSQALFKVGQ